MADWDRAEGPASALTAGQPASDDPAQAPKDGKDGLGARRALGEVELYEGGKADLEAGRDETGAGQDPFDAGCAQYASGGSFWNLGSASNGVSAAILALGVGLRLAAGEEAWGSDPAWAPAKYMLAFGLFGLAGGVTNWLAVKMLFDRIPAAGPVSLVGSGVIPKRFKEIRATVKDMLMDTFFERGFLEAYFNKKSAELKGRVDIGAKVKAVVESPDVDQMLDKQLVQLGTRPEGMLFAMMGIKPEQLKPVVKPFIVSLAGDVGPLLEKQIDMKNVMGADAIRAEVDHLLSQRLLQLTPEKVKFLVEGVIRKHLGWLVVWGNVMGGLIGIVAEASGYS
eukprot:evm.model.scf_2095.1 EVM.evm.TU.scf_2095.1   scf_2095:1343-3211(+)